MIITRYGSIIYLSLRSRQLSQKQQIAAPVLSVLIKAHGLRIPAHQVMQKVLYHSCILIIIQKIVVTCQHHCAFQCFEISSALSLKLFVKL